MSVADLVSVIVALTPVTIAALCQYGASQRNSKTCETDLAIARELAGRTTTASIELSRSASRAISERLSTGQAPSASPGDRPKGVDHEVPLPAQPS